jgi:hypothetical protein
MSEPYTMQGGKDASKRRSQRLLLQVTVILRREGKQEFTEETKTQIVNAHGALVTLEARVRPAETLYMKHKATGEEQACRVAYLGSPASGGAQVGVEFVQPAPQFWRISFPPEDWSSAGPKKPK